MKRSLLVVFAAAALTGCTSQPTSTASTEQAALAGAPIPVTSRSPEAVAQFRKGEALLNNLRNAEAAAAFGEALKLDPGFVLARAFHGQATPGPDGLKEIEDAAAAASALPEAERVEIEAMLASRRGDNGAAQKALARLIELAPTDWRGYYAQGVLALTEQRYGDAVQSLKKATELNPKEAAGAQNMIGYAALRQDDAGSAVSAFEEYARTLPQEPNPQDSLGEALLAAGRFKESEAAFAKAIELSPGFWNAHEGMAFARFYAGDWAGGRAALAKAKDTTTRPGDKVGLDGELAAAATAQGKTAEALQLLDASEKTAGAQPSDIAFVPVNRAQTLIVAGRYRDALAPANAAVKTADSGQFRRALTEPAHAGAARAHHRRSAARRRECREGDVGGARSGCVGKAG